MVAILETQNNPWCGVGVMKIIKGNYGECRICDNMDEIQGLPSLEEKSWDLCVTDPPYNTGIDKPSGLGESPKTYQDQTTFYTDNNPEYYNYCKQWIGECLRIANQTVFTPGNTNLKWWMRNYDPYDVLVWYKKNSQTGGKGAGPGLRHWRLSDWSYRACPH